ncbi:MAG: Lrp/AsnC family transcriptional regulator [Variovorax sp.]|nr:Lrp/AsnC family transcriptional regulator [Variovorax sp.]
MEEAIELDSLDRRILTVLQAQGRISFDELGSQVGLSASAALRRVRRMEEAGVIAGYAALVRARRVGLNLTAYINVRLEKHTGGSKRTPMDGFAAEVATWPEVVECVSLTGDMDFLLKVLVADMDHYTRFVMDTLLKHPSVQDCRTSFVMRPLKSGISMV